LRVFQEELSDCRVLNKRVLQIKNVGCLDEPAHRRDHPRGDDVTMNDVKAKPPSFSRRKLSAVVRKAITSYYTAEEQQEIARAAKREGISMSSFVATASLVEARRTKQKH
jgi:hypothetical protein